MDGRPVAPAGRQHQPSLPAGRQQRVGVPRSVARQMSLGLLAGAVQRAAGPWGRWEVDLVHLNHIVRGWAGSQEALPKTVT